MHEPSATRTDAVPTNPFEALLAARTAANGRFFEAHAAALAGLCHRMAERFARGGRLFACGCTPAAISDARHVAVEFVHPVIVGKRALPALGLAGEFGRLATQLSSLIRSDDVLIVFGADDRAAPDGAGAPEQAVAAARRNGALTIAFGPCRADFEFLPDSPDPLIRQELIETLYHVLWELVHVFFEHRGLLGGRAERAHHDAGSAHFLYPFLAEAEHDLPSVLEDVRRSILMKASEVAALRETTVEAYGRQLHAAARALRERLAAGGAVLALGNGGSATDAMDLVADLRVPPADWPARAAIDLTEDAAILSAVGNDVGIEAVFSRQVIAYGRETDTVIAFSTSGGSRNVIHALREARRRGLYTIAFVGYDGGPIAADGLADTLVISPSQHIPRIQEAQATGYHLLRTAVEEADAT